MKTYFKGEKVLYMLIILYTLHFRELCELIYFSRKRNPILHFRLRAGKIIFPLLLKTMDSKVERVKGNKE